MVDWKQCLSLLQQQNIFHTHIYCITEKNGLRKARIAKSKEKYNQNKKNPNRQKSDKNMLKYFLAKLKHTKIH